MVIQKSLLEIRSSLYEQMASSLGDHEPSFDVWLSMLKEFWGTLFESLQVGADSRLIRSHCNQFTDEQKYVICQLVASYRQMGDVSKASVVLDVLFGVQGAANVSSTSRLACFECLLTILDTDEYFDLSSYEIGLRQHFKESGPSSALSVKPDFIWNQDCEG